MGRPPSDAAPVALVTGGAKRVGRATCLALARSGCDLIVTYNTSDADAKTLKAEIEALGQTCTIVRLVLDDPETIEQTCDQIAGSIDRLDILVHNASIYSPSPLETITAEQALRHFTINALAPLLITKALRAKLELAALPGGGSIVAMADIHVLGRPRAGFAAYSMSKAALVEQVRTLAVELGPRIRVNAVAPGVVQWPDEGDDTKKTVQQAYLSRVPLERAGTPEEAAECVRWLALDATYVTGQIIRVDGGRLLS